MPRKHSLLVLLISPLLFLVGTVLVLAPPAGSWEYLLGCLSILLATLAV